MVLVTGAAGHLGCALVRELVGDGEKVRVLVLPQEDLEGLRGIPLDIVKGNVLDLDSIRRASQDVEVIYHLAGIVSIMPGRDELMRRVNVEGTANVARVARECRVRRMVYVSSIHALARPPKGTPVDERVRIDPHNPAGEYDRTKAEASLAVLSEVEAGLDAVIVCPTGIIGPYDFRGISPMTRQIRKWARSGSHLVLDGHFDFVDARDVARGMIVAARQGRRGQLYILAGDRVSVEDLFELVKENAGTRGRAFRVPLGIARLVAVFATLHSRLWGRKVQLTRYALETLESNSLISCARARGELGYQPRAMRRTIGDTVRWLRENPEPASEAMAAFERARGRASRTGRRAGVAVVTGASSGIGAATALRLASRGYKVILVARRRDRLEALAGRIRAGGGTAESLAVDLAAPGGVRTIFERVVELGEGIDVLVNSAGFGWYGYASEMSVDTAVTMIQVNNAAMAELVLHFLPLMKRRGSGHIINLSSIVGSLPSPWAVLYSATKSFVDAFTTALYRELRGSGVNVSAARPGPVLTEFYQTVRRLSSGRSIPVGKISVLPEAVADAIVKLLARPRRAVYVPAGFRVLPWIEFSFGWLVDRLAAFFLRRQPYAA
ncbi:MAG: SDR family NAD(P)-dependent oxidoreductase [Spirochaetia bacterium]|jgi:dihydroflavonol-4-reductase